MYAAETTVAHDQQDIARVYVGNDVCHDVIYTGAEVALCTGGCNVCLELFIGCETWSREGVYFFPDACFYEFIPEDEMNRNMEDPCDSSL